MKWNNHISRPNNPTRKEVEESVEDLERKGVVMEHIDGGIYLDLDDDWIYKALEVVSNYGYELPPFFHYSGEEGAHIKIADYDEMKGDPGSDVLGRTVDFQVVHAYASFPNLMTYGLENIMKINILSAELDNIREELTGKRTPPNGKFFFIVVAVRNIVPLKSLGMSSVREIIPGDDDEDEEINTDKDEGVEEITDEDDEDMNPPDDDDKEEKDNDPGLFARFRNIINNIFLIY